jgi:ferredoxin--NADP+ reductase
MTHPNKRSMQDDMPLLQVSVESLQRLAPNAFLLQLPKLAPFVPGQVIGITSHKSIPPRLFSICSANTDTYWDILFNVKQDGILSPKLGNLSKGDSLYVSMPFGSFTDSTQPSWWIATGTGIAPFRAMLRSGLGENKFLLHGARSAANFYFAEECACRLQQNYLRCVSQGTSEGAYSGRLTNWLRENNTLPTDRPYLLCGSAEMVVEVRDILIAKGIPFGNIRAEIYF